MSKNKGKVTWHGAKVKAAMLRGAGEGIREAGRAVLKASQARVPEDTSRLKETGDLTVDQANLRAEITYGRGLPDPRAVIVHEQLDIHHDSGTAKYLENPLNELATEVGGLIATSINKTLK